MTNTNEKKKNTNEMMNTRHPSLPCHKMMTVLLKIIATTIPYNTSIPYNTTFLFVHIYHYYYNYILYYIT